tara:strand:- start:49 stop:381 length:333 start_codon:yes stop_codon:yes gene_type:complete
MHIAMNRFEVANGLQKQFEQSIKEHFQQLKGTKGYLSFHLIRGGTNGAVTFYSSHTKWANKEDFLKWGGKVQFCKMQNASVGIEPVKNRKLGLTEWLTGYLKSFNFRAKV